MARRLLLGSILLMTFASFSFAQNKLNLPETRRGDTQESIHGVTLDDPYRWLEDQNSPETRAWITAQNDYTKSLIGNLPTREGISKRLTELLTVDTFRVPYEQNGRYFYTERRAGQDQFVLYMRKGLHGIPEVLVDPHPMSPDHSTSVGLVDISEDASVVAYNIRRGGADEEEIHFLNTDTKKNLPDVLPVARYFGVSIMPDKSGFYYMVMTAEGPRVRWHKFGSELSQDQEVFGKGYGPEKIIDGTVSEDGHYLLITVSYGASSDKTEIWYKDLRTNGGVEPLIKDIDARFFAVPGGDHIYVHTNWRAPNGRVLDIDMKHPARPYWMQIIPEESDAVIESVDTAGGKLAVKYLKNVVNEIKFFTPTGQPAGQVTFPALGTATNFHGRWLGREAFFSFSSFHIPQTIYAYDTAKGTKSVFDRENAPVNSSEFELKQVWYESKDKTKVPMFILYKKGTKLEGANPTLLTAYGGFNLSMTPQFSALAVTWVEHGGVYALPNLRGGGEFGENWHKAGMMEKKQNVFDDFYAAADYLIQNKYTNPEKLSIAGGSNGGLLMGAAMTQRPELFHAVVCMYPLLDMIRYQNFLVAKFWVPEYGSSEDPEQFQYILKYSPYQNVHKGTKYPAVLFMTGDADTRVAPLHARKMAAEVQWANGSDRPILLHYDTEAGHSEGRSVKKMVQDATDEISFLWWQLGVSPNMPATKVATK